MPLKVFISHCWKDKTLASFKAIEMKVRDAGHDVWVDSRRIEVGAVIEDEFLAGLARADVVLVLWSDNSPNSNAQMKEVNEAVRQGKSIIPCKISASNPANHPALAGRKYVSFDNLDLGLLTVSQVLIRLTAKMNPTIGADENLRRQTDALDNAMVEADDFMARRQHRESSSAKADEAAQSSWVTIIAMARAIRGMAQSGHSEEDGILIQVADGIEAIARAHPNPEDDALCQSLFLKALEESDPHDRSPKVRMLRQLLVAQGISAPHD